MSTLLLWGPVVAQMAVIFVVSSIPELGPLPGQISDKTGHGIGYALLSVLLVRALAGGRLRGITWRVVLAGIVLSVLYGISDEFHQRFVPGRTADVVDVAADAYGAGVGAAIAGVLRMIRDRRLVALSRR